MILASLIQSQLFWIILWASIIVMALVVELSTYELVSIWFCFSGLITLVLAIFDVAWWIQLLVFFVTSILALILSRVLYKKKLDHTPSVATNADSLIGQDILVLTRVEKDHPGSGKFRDVVWTLITHSSDVFEKDEFAVVENITGNKIIIKKKEVK